MKVLGRESKALPLHGSIIKWYRGNIEPVDLHNVRLVWSFITSDAMAGAARGRARLNEPWRGLRRTRVLPRPLALMSIPVATGVMTVPAAAGATSSWEGEMPRGVRWAIRTFVGQIVQ